MRLLIARLEQLEAAHLTQDRTTAVYRRLGIAPGERPDPSNPLHRFASLLDGNPNTAANVSAYLDALEQFGREERL